MTSRLDNRQKLKEGMSLGNLSIVAFHAAKVPTNLFSIAHLFSLLIFLLSSTLIFLLTPDYNGLTYSLKSTFLYDSFFFSWMATVKFSSIGLGRQFTIG